jgi:N-acetyl-anhydromuramyl-L-alanine amidase AmpD
MALTIDAAGMVTDARVTNSRILAIERGTLKSVSGIVIHQTDSETASATLNGYKKAQANGAHFLIDTDGTIHQTASVLQRTNHVGKLKSRCIAEASCTIADYPKKAGAATINSIELKKALPSRYPSNGEAIGIELVGKSALPANFEAPKYAASWTQDRLLGEFGIYPTPSPQQISSLKWLVEGLMQALNVASSELFEHPTVSWKNKTEAKDMVNTLRFLWAIDASLRVFGVSAP